MVSAATVKCAGCSFAVTGLTKSHCCVLCQRTPGKHGPRCERRLRKCKNCDYASRWQTARTTAASCARAAGHGPRCQRMEMPMSDDDDDTLTPATSKSLTTCPRWNRMRPSSERAREARIVESPTRASATARRRARRRRAAPSMALPTPRGTSARARPPRCGRRWRPAERGAGRRTTAGGPPLPGALRRAQQQPGCRRRAAQGRSCGSQQHLHRRCGRRRRWPAGGGGGARATHAAR